MIHLSNIKAVGYKILQITNHPKSTKAGVERGVRTSEMAKETTAPKELELVAE